MDAICGVGRRGWIRSLVAERCRCTSLDARVKGRSEEESNCRHTPRRVQVLEWPR